MSDPRFLNAAPFAVISNGDDTGVAIAAKTWNGSTPQEPITRVHIKHTHVFASMRVSLLVDGARIQQSRMTRTTHKVSFHQSLVNSSPECGLAKTECW